MCVLLFLDQSFEEDRLVSLPTFHFLQPFPIFHLFFVCFLIIHRHSVCLSKARSTRKYNRLLIACTDAAGERELSCTTGPGRPDRPTPWNHGSPSAWPWCAAQPNSCASLHKRRQRDRKGREGRIIPFCARQVSRAAWKDGTARVGKPGPRNNKIETSTPSKCAKVGPSLRWAS